MCAGRANSDSLHSKTRPAALTALQPPASLGRLATLCRLCEASWGCAPVLLGLREGVTLCLTPNVPLKALLPLISYPCCIACEPCRWPSLTNQRGASA